MNLKPLNDRVIIQPKETEEVSKGGIILPETASKERPIEGVVVAVGPGKLNNDGQRISLQVKKDDNVVFSKYAGTEVKFGEDSYLILKEEDILAVVAN
ncbi:MAG: co-chaperone GroES [Candidatus Riflebacteria bacterium]|nr:co-chaperone GroES [Candidatus Riflebacteria bacterium]